MIMIMIMIIITIQVSIPTGWESTEYKLIMMHYDHDPEHDDNYDHPGVHPPWVGEHSLPTRTITRLRHSPRPALATGEYLQNQNTEINICEHAAFAVIAFHTDYQDEDIQRDN